MFFSDMLVEIFFGEKYHEAIVTSEKIDLFPYKCCIVVFYFYNTLLFLQKRW